MQCFWNLLNATSQIVFARTFLRGTEERKLASKKYRARPSMPRQAKIVVEESEVPKVPRSSGPRRVTANAKASKQETIFVRLMFRQMILRNKKNVCDRIRIAAENITVGSYSKKCLPIVIAQGRQETLLASLRSGLESRTWTLLLNLSSEILWVTLR